MVVIRPLIMVLENPYHIYRIIYRIVILKLYTVHYSAVAPNLSPDHRVIARPFSISYRIENF